MRTYTAQLKGTRRNGVGATPAAATPLWTQTAVKPPAAYSPLKRRTMDVVAPQNVTAGAPMLRDAPPSAPPPPDASAPPPPGCWPHRREAAAGAGRTAAKHRREAAAGAAQRRRRRRDETTKRRRDAPRGERAGALGRHELKNASAVDDAERRAPEKKKTPELPAVGAGHGPRARALDAAWTREVPGLGNPFRTRLTQRRACSSASPTILV